MAGRSFRSKRNNGMKRKTRGFIAGVEEFIELSMDPFVCARRRLPFPFYVGVYLGLKFGIMYIRK